MMKYVFIAMIALAAVLTPAIPTQATTTTDFGSNPFLRDLNQETGGKLPLDIIQLRRETPYSLLFSILQIAFTLIGLGLLVTMVYAGWLWMSSQGNSETINRAKKLMFNAFIGIVLIFMAYSLTLYVSRWIEDATGSGGFRETIQTPGFFSF